MPRTKIISALYISVAALLLLFCFQCGRKDSVKRVSAEDRDSMETAKWQNLGPDAKYVGMGTCRTCHENIYQSFKQTGMGQSFAVASKAKSVAGFHQNAPLYDKYNDLYYQPYWHDTALMVKEYRMDGRDTTYSHTEKINYIIGSGHHTNSHIVNQNGYLYQAPFTWFVQQAKLDFPPGFENGFNSRFSREIGIECISCHNGYPAFEPKSENKYLSIPEGIDCERCHGPGSVHVKNKLTGIVVDTAHGPDYSIVNPKKLPYNRQIDVCQRCHLQGDAVLKEGKTFFDFRPGMKLSNVIDEFLPVYENQEHGFLMAAHAERLQKSKCFLKTQNGKNGEKLNCITCHNPHISVKYTKEAYFIQKCQGCHTAPHKNDPQVLQTPGSNCITCHMPRSSAVDIPHVTITDHFIRVQKKEKDNGAIGLGKFKGLSCINDKNPDALTVARAYMFFYAKFQHNTENLDSAYKYLSGYKPEAKPADYIYYYYLKNDNEQVIATATHASSPINSAIANYQAGQAYFNMQQPVPAITYFRKAADMQPYNLDYRIMMATVYTLSKDFNDAEKELDFVISENPKLAAGWNGMAFVDLATNRLAEAGENLRKALAIDPDFEPAHLNRIKYYIALNKFDEARKVVDMLLKKNPKNRDALAQKQLLDKAGL
jgi:hypothetical protein